MADNGQLKLCNLTDSKKRIFARQKIKNAKLSKNFIQNSKKISKKAHKAMLYCKKRAQSRSVDKICAKSDDREDVETHIFCQNTRKRIKTVRYDLEVGAKPAKSYRTEGGIRYRQRPAGCR